MSLYRIILADDEEEVRRAIIRKMDWEALGFQVVGDAENGQDALEKIEQLEPDVVMTDIRMPYMDGLTLTARIRAKYPSIKVLIFSGYDDFEYAQQAIKLNVTEYILKPVNVEELTGILERVRENLDEEIKQRRDVTLLRESYRSSLPILRELFLNELVRGTADGAVIESRLQEYEVDILHADRWITAVISVEQNEMNGAAGLSLHQEQELIPISVRKLTEDHLKAYGRFAVFNAREGITIIAALEADRRIPGFLDLLEDICKESRRILEVPVTIGVGLSCSSLETLRTSYQSATDALGYKAIVGSGSVIYIRDMEPVSRGKLQLEAKDEAELVAAIKFGPREQIDASARMIAGRMDDVKVHVRQYQAYMASVINCLIRLTQKYDQDMSQVFGECRDYEELLGRMEKKEEFARWIAEAGCRIHNSMNQERDNTTRQVILEAKRYIQEHYPEPDLSVEKLCSHLHMSPAYFSTMFKKETGQAYIAYLTEIRLNKAVELLNETNDKTYVIAAKVGYQEQNYFSYVFKKKFGVSPTKFRGA